MNVYIIIVKDGTSIHTAVVKADNVINAVNLLISDNIIHNGLNVNDIISVDLMSASVVWIEG